MTFRSRVLHAASAFVVVVIPYAMPAASTPVAEYPSRPIVLVVPFGPASVTDILGRIAAKGLSDALGQPVVVENKPGAGGNIGATMAARAAPDGYTLLLGPTSTNAVNPSLFKNLRFDALRDFIAVSNVAIVPNVLVVNPDVSVQSVKELIAVAKKGNLSYASTGNGGSMHLSGELFNSMTNANLVHIPYGGGGAALNDLLPGRVQVMFCNLPLCLPHIKSGKLRALAITSSQRSALLPDVPSMAEAGLPQYEVNGWFGLFVPAKTDPAIVNKLNAEVRKILDKPEIRAQLKAQGAEPAGGPSIEFGAFVKAEHDKWAKVINDARITLE